MKTPTVLLLVVCAVVLVAVIARRYFLVRPDASHGGPRTGIAGTAAASGGEGLYVAPAGESQARAAALLPMKASEDASHLLRVSSLPVPEQAHSRARDYVPDTATEWVVDVDFTQEATVTPGELAKVFDAPWRRTHGGMTLYGYDPDSHHWTYVNSADAPKRVSRLKLAWSYFTSSEGGGPAASADIYDRRLDAVSRSVAHLPESTVKTSVESRRAATRGREIEDLVAHFDRSAVLVLRAPPGAAFQGRDIWDVMLCLGLRWGDMDCFHWVNNGPSGDDSFFSVETSTPPGYFLPEEIAAGRLRTEDLIFAFSIPRCAAPASVFDSMVRAVEYAQKRLGGSVLDGKGKEANYADLKREIRAITQGLTSAGFAPGTDSALHLF